MRRDRGTFVFGAEPGAARHTARPDLFITVPSINRSATRSKSRGKGSSLQSSTREGKLESAREVKHVEIREPKMIAC